MPSFTATIPNLQTVGPVVDVHLAVGSSVEAALKASGQTIPSPVQLTAMIDTGASGTVIRQGLANQLGLHPVGVTAITTPSSTNVPCYEYVVQLVFPNNVVVGTTAIEAPLQGQHIQCLIGRNVLAHGVLIYIGYNNLFSLSF